MTTRRECIKKTIAGSAMLSIGGILPGLRPMFLKNIFPYK